MTIFVLMRSPYILARLNDDCDMLATSETLYRTARHSCNRLTFRCNLIRPSAIEPFFWGRLNLSETVASSSLATDWCWARCSSRRCCARAHGNEAGAQDPVGVR